MKKHILVALVFIFIGFICFVLPNWMECHKDSLNLFGTFSSILGIIIVIFQLRHTTSIAEATAEKSKIIEEQAEAISRHAEDTKLAVEKSLERTSRIITLAEASQIVHLPNEIQDALQRGDLGRAYEKMRTLKDSLTELKVTPQFNKEDVAAELTNFIGEMNVRLKSLSQAISDDKKEMYAQSKTIDLMENIRTFLKFQSTVMKQSNIE